MHGDLVIGTAVPASPRTGNGWRARQVTKGPISAGRQCQALRSGSGASRDEAPEESSSLARRGFRWSSDRWKRSGTQEWLTQEGPWNIGRFWLSGQAGRVERPVILRVAGRVGRFGSSQEGVVWWEATPELVSQDRERVRLAFGLSRPGYEHRQILRSAQWGLAAMPAPISFVRRPRGPSHKGNSAADAASFLCAPEKIPRSCGAAALAPVTIPL